MKQECENCKKKIETDKDKYVMVETASGHTIMDQTYFHFDCWKEYFRNCVSNKIKGMASTAMGMVRNTLDDLQNERLNK